MKSQHAGKMTCTVCISDKEVWEMAGCRQKWFSKGKAGFLQAPHMQEFWCEVMGSCQDVLPEIPYPGIFSVVPFFLDSDFNPSLKDDRVASVHWDFLLRMYRKFFYFANMFTVHFYVSKVYSKT